LVEELSRRRRLQLFGIVDKQCTFWYYYFGKTLSGTWRKLKSFVWFRLFPSIGGHNCIPEHNFIPICETRFASSCRLDFKIGMGAGDFLDTLYVFHMIQMKTEFENSVKTW
jgi:hypothetical protein